MAPVLPTAGVSRRLPSFPWSFNVRLPWPFSLFRKKVDLRPETQRSGAWGEQLAADRPDHVRLIDLAGWMQTLPGGELDGDIRPDGVHFTPETSLYVADRFLGPAILAAWADIKDRPGS